jgi:hypothetical protein
VFILTHHPRDPVEMEGGTTFHFVTDGIESALEQAREAAGGKDVRLWGGAEERVDREPLEDRQGLAGLRGREGAHARLLELLGDAVVGIPASYDL